MKKSESIIIVGLFLMVPLLFSCGKEKMHNPKNDLMDFEVFQSFGDLHNDFMTNIQSEFNPIDEIKSTNDRLEYVNSIHIGFVEKCALSDIDRKILEQEFQRAKYLYNVNSVLELVNKETLIKSEKETQTLYSILDTALNYQIINKFESSILLELIDLSNLCFNGLISQGELGNSIKQLKEDWLAAEYDSNSNYGYISGYAIAISLSSLEWWEKNAEGQELMTKEIKLIPAWVAADAVGALWGAASGAIGSYLVNGEVNWGSVGFGALSGAVAGSTGVVGKVAKWISKL